MPGARLLFSLDPAVAYLNHGGFGAVPLPVQRAQQRLREEMESNPHLFFTTGLMDRVEHARRHAADFLGADPEGSTFIANTTAGISLILASIKIGPGDQIVTTSHGYGAVDMAVDRLCATTAATHTIIPIGLDATDEEIVSTVESAIRGRRTRLLIVDQVTSPTARVMPVSRLVGAARVHGVPIAVDAAHAPGALPVNVDQIGADFWVGNLHKWLFAPRPAALVHVGPEWRDRISPLVVSWDQHEGYPKNIEMQGTLDYTSWLAAPTAIQVMQNLGVDAVRSHNAALVKYGQNVVADALGLAASAALPEPGAAEASMRVVPLPEGVAATHATASELRQRIADELRVIVTINPWQGQGLLRLSAQVYNRADDYDRLAAGLPRLIKAMSAT